MNQKLIKKARMILGEVISENIELVGKNNKNMQLLCEATERLVLLLKRLSNPKYAEAQDKLSNSKIWND